MLKFAIGLCSLVLLGLCLTEDAAAQQLAMPRMGYPVVAGQPATADLPMNNPVVSPYLNLVMAEQLGIPAGYQTMVRPFVDQRATANRQEASIQRLQQQVRGGGRRGASAGLRETGHQSHFSNYSHYYGTTSSQ